MKNRRWVALPAIGLALCLAACGVPETEWNTVKLACTAAQTGESIAYTQTRTVQNAQGETETYTQGECRLQDAAWSERTVVAGTLEQPQMAYEQKWENGQMYVRHLQYDAQGDLLAADGSVQQMPPAWEPIAGGGEVPQTLQFFLPQLRGSAGDFASCETETDETGQTLYRFRYGGRALREMKAQAVQGLETLYESLPTENEALRQNAEAEVARAKKTTYKSAEVCCTLDAAGRLCRFATALETEQDGTVTRQETVTVLDGVTQGT